MLTDMEVKEEEQVLVEDKVDRNIKRRIVRNISKNNLLIKNIPLLKCQDRQCLLRKPNLNHKSRRSKKLVKMKYVKS